MDTASMLVTRRARAAIDRELEAVAGACARLADEHSGTLMPARTLLQQALPTTFGFKAAGWLLAVLDARDRLAALPPAAELGGAAGTLAALGTGGLAVAERLAERLELEAPDLPWHARARVAEIEPRWRSPRARSRRSPATSSCSHRPRSARSPRRPTAGAEDRRRCRTSGTRSARRSPWPARSACARRRRSCSAPWRRNTSVPRVRGRPSGRRSAALSPTPAPPRPAREALEGLEVRPERMRENLDPQVMAEAGLATEPEDYLGAAGTFVARALERYREWS